MDHAVRRARLTATLGGHDVDALFVTHPPDVGYLTGFTGSSAALLVPAVGEPLLVTDGRYAEQAEGEAPNLERIITRTDDWLAERLEPGASVGVDDAHISWRRARALVTLLDGREVRPLGGVVGALRRVKDGVEQAVITDLCALVDEVLAGLAGWLEPGLSEREVARRLDEHLVRLGADAPAFATIVASGPNSARPHHQPGERRLGEDELVLLDLGAKGGGYHSDCSRTVVLGVPSDEQLRLHEAVAEAQRRGVAAARVGALAGDVDAACRASLVEAGLGDAFVHPAGHGVGLEIHEAPMLRAGAQEVLAAGEIVTVEPGAYLAGVGGVRIEDTVLVTDDGGVALTTSPRAPTLA